MYLYVSEVNAKCSYIFSQDMFIREPNEEINWTGFFRPFETPLWITFLGISIMFGIISKVLLILTDQNSSLEESIFLSFSGIFFQQGKINVIKYQIFFNKLLS